MNFDHFIVVDWSARSAASPVKPHKDAIWLAEGKADGDRKRVEYFRTRRACYDYLVSRLKTLVKQGKRTFVGFDMSFSYPKGMAKALKLKGKPKWKSIWALLSQLIKDDDRNRNNRFKVGGELNRRINASLGPFWGVTSGQSGIFIGPKKDFEYPVVTKRAVLEEKRIVELRHKKMQSSWKLAYTGSVGSQTLMGIPYLYRLRFEESKLESYSTIWPFETGFNATDSLIVYGEIWPSLVERPKKDKIPDREQVKCYLKWLREQQLKGSLSDLFTRLPKGLSEKEAKVCINEEGWILGA